MKRTLVGFLIILLSLFWLASTVQAQTPPPPATDLPEQRAIFYFFWGDGCPHCAKAKPYLESLAEKYPELELRQFEVYYNEQNANMLVAMAQHYQIRSIAVPAMFLGTRSWIGYGEDMQPELEAAVQECLRSGCPDAAAVLQPSPAATPLPENLPTPRTVSTPEALPTPVVQPTAAPAALQLPLVGSISLQNRSAFVSTILIAFVDGFNPCSLWVLSMLLALTLHSGSRKKLFVIGLVFLTITALIYAAFIAGLFSVLKLTSALKWIQPAMAVLALVLGLFNLKEFFWFQKGPSLSIPAEQKPGLARRMRAVIDDQQSLWGIVLATVALAAGVSLIEFSCTAGFPVLWTNLLLTQGIGGWEFWGLLLLYMIIYQLDEIFIFLAAVITLRSSRLQEKHGRWLKLLGGVLMVSLALLMLFRPSVLTELEVMLMVFLIAFLITVFIGVLERLIRKRRK